eukprot:638833-Ditylum_brightwellii.AAC.1
MGKELGGTSFFLCHGYHVLLEKKLKKQNGEAVILVEEQSSNEDISSEDDGMVNLKEKDTYSLSNSALHNNIGEEENAEKEKTWHVESDDGRSNTEK